MSTNTYVALDKITVSSSVPSVTFTSIPQGYTDLVVVCNFIQSSAYSLEARVGNGSVDTGNNYSNTTLIGKANNTAASTRRSNYSYLTAFEQNGASSGVWTMHLMNYTNTNVYKTILFRNGNAGSDIEASVQLWRSTAAINTLQIFAGQGAINFTSGSTFSLYGIAAQVTPGTAKATGGTITYDNFGRVIHTFTSSGTFTPSEPLTGVDYLVVAGGGGGGSAGSNSVRGAGGGGAGGYRTFTSQNISTAQTITIGAGGAGAPASSIAVGSNGSNSVASTITSTGGGGGAAQGLNAAAGGSGGGAGDAGSSAGTGNQGGYSPVEGYAGGANGPGAVNSGAGGGGSSAVGSPGIDLGASGGAGGAGTSNSITSTATTYAVGGNGGSYNSGVAGASGTTNRGNGGGGAAGSSGGYVAGGAGGSGVVIIRYSGL